MSCLKINRFFLELNTELAEVWPNITEKKEQLPDAEEWDGVPDKLKTYGAFK